MRIRAFAYASFALLAAYPTSSLAGATVTATITAPSGDVAAGATVQVTCRAEGDVPGMMGSTTVLSVAVGVTAGTVTPSQFTGAQNVPCTSAPTKTCSVILGTASWVTPPAAGTYTATCTATSQGTFGGPVTSSASASLTTVVSSVLPPVVSGISGPIEVVTGQTGSYQVSATDPNSPALPLTYTWAASAGQITPDSANPAAATWQAPSAVGTATLSVTVSNGTSQVQVTKPVSSSLATFQAGLPVAMGAPLRLSSDGSGAMIAVDGQQGTTGRIVLVTARGETLGLAELPEPALAVTQGAGLVWVTTANGNIYKVDPKSGQVTGKLALERPFKRPIGIAYDASRMVLWVADLDANQIRLIHPDGTTVAVIDSVGGGPIKAPVDVAVDAAAGRAWVLVQWAESESSLPPGSLVALSRHLHAFDLAGSYVGSFAPHGNGAGQVSRGGGLGIDRTSRVFVSDIFQGTVQTYDKTGAFVGTIGAFGQDVGQLTNPAGIAIMGNGDVAVANASLGRIDRFGTGAPLPTCQVNGLADSDCDGMPDEWELANGLNPNWAGDALLDLDGDGLTALQEFLSNTNPRLADTDGDGYPDGWELANGFDPSNADDHRARVSVSGPSQVNPGYVRLTATASGPGTCGVTWNQVSGPKISLQTSSGAASFVARTAATYEFDAVATCSGQTSSPARLAVAVRDVAPLPDPGRIQVVRPGSRIGLDARRSSDANGGVLSFLWDQTLGNPVLASQAGGYVTAPARGAGLYGFQVTVTDSAGNASTAEVPVLVTGGPAPTAIAVATPAEAEVGSTVALDASASFFGTTVLWSQVSGPTAQLGGADTSVAWFVPSVAGRYVFEVQVANDELRSPPARVEVLVAEAGKALPTVSATAASVVGIGTPVSLDATASAGAVEYAWKQVAGPAAGLNDADRATATAVAFAPGFYVFEVSVKDGAAESRPARVAFEARTAGRAIPQARASCPTPAPIAGQYVLLDGRGSVGATRYRWTQVEGPWVVLQSPTEAVTAFRPLAPGRYAFELEVDDGTARSAPSRVEVNVSKGEVK